MKIKHFAYITLVFVLGLGLAACEPEGPDMEYSPVWPVSGEWWVTYEFDDGTGNIDDHYGVGHTRLLTYNDADDAGDSIWVNDNENFWEFIVKAGVNVEAKTFSVTEGKDLVWDDNTTITKGQVFELEGGDSIYMEIVWASDPTTTYIVSGRRVKGFIDASGSTSYEADYGD